MSEQAPTDGAPAPVPPITNEFIERLRAKQCPLEKVETSIGEFYFRRRTGADRYRMLVIQSALEKQNVLAVPPALWVGVHLLNPDGSYVFANAEEGFLFIDSLDGEVVDELWGHFLRISGLGKRALETAEKKSSSSQSSDSGTTSPSS